MTGAKLFRLINNYSQASVAKAVGIRQCTISLFEEGKLNLNQANRNRLAGFLKCSPEVLQRRYTPTELMERLNG